jgi:hypothetical protein
MSRLKRNPGIEIGHSSLTVRTTGRVALALIGLGLAGASVYWTSRSSERNEQVAVSTRQVETTRQADQIPPFFESEEAAKPLPATLSPASFSNSSVARAYRVAREIPEVLAQQPCYCYCDKFGHRGLLDCYRDNHGAG